MSDERESDVIARLRQEIADLGARMQAVRQETSNVVTNAAEEQIRAQLEEIASLKDQLRQCHHLTRSLRDVANTIPSSHEMVVRPRWSPNPLGIERNAALLLMPFQPDWAGPVRNAVTGALRRLNMECKCASTPLGGGEIMSEVWTKICECGIVIADMTGANANVTYEVGLADALGRPTLLLCQHTGSDAVPFNFLGHHRITYAVEALDQLAAAVMKDVPLLRTTYR